MASSFVLYGAAGIGKTEMAGSFPKPLFIVDPLETGVEDSADMGFIAPVDIWEFGDYKHLLSCLEDSKRDDVSTVVIETLRGVENAIYQEAMLRDDFKSWQDFFSFDRGPDAAGRYVAEFLMNCKQLLKAGKNLVLTGHCDDKSKSNAQGADYQRTVPDVQRIRKFWNPVAKWVQNIYYMEQDYKVESGKSPTDKGKVQSQASRSIWTNYDLSYEAKNRYRLPARISMGETGAEAVNNLMSAIKEAKHATR